MLVCLSPAHQLDVEARVRFTSVRSDDAQRSTWHTWALLSPEGPRDRALPQSVAVVSTDSQQSLVLRGAQVGLWVLAFAALGAGVVDIRLAP